MTISKELLDELLSSVERPGDLLGDKGLIKELKLHLMERMLDAERTKHLGYEPHGELASQQANRRNMNRRGKLVGAPPGRVSGRKRQCRASGGWHDLAPARRYQRRPFHRDGTPR
jgi:putative transposase